MSYVEDSLGTGETIKHMFRFHWVIDINITLFHLLMLIVSLKFWPFLNVLSLLIMCPSLIYHLSIKNTEHAVTSKRVIFKKSIIARNTEEQLLKKVETIEIKQGVLGRLLGYGDVKITGTGISAVSFKGIDNPLEVKSKIQALL